MKTFFALGFLFVTASIIIALTSYKSVKPKEETPYCGCYANGKFYTIGTSVCLGGYWASCIDKTPEDGNKEGDCGWDYMEHKKEGYKKCP